MDNQDNSSRIPRELLHSQNERLSSKHIQTLSFLQELADENKDLKIRIKQLEAEQIKCEEFHSLADESRERMKSLQDEYLRKQDAFHAELTEKHKAELMTVVGEKLDQEKYYLEEIVKMRDEIDDLERINESLIISNKELNQADDQLPLALAKVKNLENELEKSNLEKNELREELSDRIKQLQDLLSLKDNHESLLQDLQEAKQKNSELHYKITKLEKDLKQAEVDKEQQEISDQLRSKLERVVKECDVKSEMISEQGSLIDSLKDKLEQYRNSLIQCQKEKENLVFEYNEVLTELNHLRKQLAKKDGSSFKDFVGLKREIKSLRYQNEDLKELLTTPSNTNLPNITTKDNIPRRKSSTASLKSIKSITYQ